MVETVRKGYWEADAATKTKLLTEYIDSVNAARRRAAPSSPRGNPRLSKYVLEQGKAAGIPVPALEGFQRAMEKAMGATVTDAASAAENFVRSNEAPPASPQVQAPQQAADPGTVAGRAGPACAAKDARGLCDGREGSVTRARRAGSAAVIVPPWVTAGLTLPVLAYLVVWRRRHRRR